MRTVKQLTIERELLRQYTELIHQTFMSVIRSQCASVSFNFFSTVELIKIIQEYWY